MPTEILSIPNMIVSNATKFNTADMVAGATSADPTNAGFTDSIISTLIQTSWQAELYMALATIAVFGIFIYYSRDFLRLPGSAEEENKSLVVSENAEAVLPADDELGGSMSFLDHLTELRIRLIRALISLSLAVILSFIFVDKIQDALLACVPVTKVKMVALYPIEIFMTWIKVSVVSGFFIAFPCIFYEIWMFVAPGLYKRERNFALPLAISAWLCFIIGGLFCYFIVFRFALLFFASMAGSTVENTWSISNYLNFMIQFLLAFAIVFEEPVVILLLAKIGIVTKQKLKDFRPYAVVGLFILAAVVTPPDAVSQCLCAAPLLVLYEISIIVVGISEKKGLKESA